jgi:hypothetical protein
MTGKLYSVPASSMEPALRCARPNPGCSAETADRVYVVSSGGRSNRIAAIWWLSGRPAVVLERSGASGRS